MIIGVGYEYKKVWADTLMSGFLVASLALLISLSNSQHHINKNISPISILLTSVILICGASLTKQGAMVWTMLIYPLLAYVIINNNNKSVNVETIQNLVASYFNLNLQEMLSPRRSRVLARPRQIAMYLAKQHTTNSLPDIGRKFSNRDHTTVIHAVKKIDELIKKDNEIRQSVIEIKKKFL